MAHTLDWIYYEITEPCGSITVTETDQKSACNLKAKNIYVSDEKLRKTSYSLAVTPKSTLNILREIKSDHTITIKYLLVKCEASGELLGMVILFSNREVASNEWVKHIFINQILPYANLGKSHKVKQKTKDIVRMLAFGLDRNEISELIHLTVRGVDYHLDTARAILGAKNRSSLVYKAMLEGWLT